MHTIRNENVRIISARLATKQERRFYYDSPVTLELSKENMDKAHSFGNEYRAVLSRLLELAMNDKELVRKAQL